jgi:hypothetical protein
MTLPTDTVTLQAATPAQHAAWHNEIDTYLPSLGLPTVDASTPSGHRAHHEALNSATGLAEDTAPIDEGDLGHLIPVHQRLHYYLQCTGVAATPATFNQTLINNNPGATFCLAEGTYEMGGLNVAGRTLKGSRRTIFDGTVPVTNWTGPVSGVWQSTGHTFNPDVVTPAQNPAMELHPENGHFADLLRDGVRMTRVLSTTTPAAGQWAWDYTTDIVYSGSDPSGHAMRLTNQNNAFTGGGTLVGITMQWYGRIALPDNVWDLDGVAIVDNHGEAVKIGSGSHLHGGWLIARNGQYGISGGGNGSVVEDGELTENNCLHFQRSSNDKSYWDAGATKFLLADGLTVRRVNSHDNFADGMWFDIDNRNVEVYDCQFDGNERYGVFYEINRDAHIHDNTMLLNVEGGLYISTAGPVVAEYNIIEGPRGVFIREDARGNDSVDGQPRHAAGNRIRNNTVRHRRTTTIEGTNIGFGGLDAGQTSLDNQWHLNTYYVPTLGQQDWQGASSFPLYTFANWQAAGFDTDSTVAVG